MTLVGRRLAAMAAGLAGMLAAAAVAACGPSQARPVGEMRTYTDSFTFAVTPDPTPPHARERTRYKIVVYESKSSQPVERGEGRIFATNRDGKTVWDGFALGQEPGTYYANMNFLTSGLWAIAIQFRRDSTKPLQKTLDWTQEVYAERPVAP